jgi:hypothetical protein
MILFIVVLIPVDLYIDKDEEMSFRLGYFSDTYKRGSFLLTDISGGLVVTLMNCNLSFVESPTGITTSIDYFISTSIGSDITETSTSININKNGSNSPRCYLELYIPTGVSLPSMTIDFNGNTEIFYLKIEDKFSTGKYMDMTSSVLTIKSTLTSHA